MATKKRTPDAENRTPGAPGDRRPARKPTDAQILRIQNFADGLNKKEKQLKSQYDPMTRTYVLTEDELSAILDAIDYCLEQIENLTPGP